MLLLVKKIEKIVEFEEGYEVNVELKLLNCKELEDKAKEIDKENYSDNCFGISFNYVKDEDMIYINFIPNCIYYIDEDGEKNYFEVEPYLINNIQRVLLVEIRKFVKDKENYITENKVEYDNVI